MKRCGRPMTRVVTARATTGLTVTEVGPVGRGEERALPSSVTRTALHSITPVTASPFTAFNDRWPSSRQAQLAN
jgi:hypothetical protein